MRRDRHDVAEAGYNTGRINGVPICASFLRDTVACKIGLHPKLFVRILAPTFIARTFPYLLL